MEGLPAGGKLHNATFSHNRLKSKGNVSEKLTVENLGSLENVCREIIDFFQQNMQICFTEMDKLRAESLEGPQFDPKTLNEVSVKQTTHLLWKYAESMGEMHDLTPKEVRSLFQDINYNIITNKLPKTSVVMENQEIVDIEGAVIKEKHLHLIPSHGEGSSSSTSARSSREKREGRDRDRDADLVELIASGKVTPISSDFHLEYRKTKMATRWKRLLKSIG